MISDPLVSVLMTAYNRDKYISFAIRSVLESTYQNWELIIVDDGSTDNTVQIVKEFENADDRISLRINESNLGDYPNRNKAASYAKGKYLKYLDADDLIYPHGLQQLVYYMEQFDDVGYGICSLPQDDKAIYPIKLSGEEAYKWHYFKEKIFHKAPLSVIIKTEVFHKIGGFTGKRMVGDFEMWHLISRHYPVILMPAGIVWYRVHDEQETAIRMKDPMISFQYKILAEQLVKDTHCPLSNKDKGKSLAVIRDEKCLYIFSTAKYHSLKKAFVLFKASNLSPIDLINYLSKRWLK